MVGQAHHAERVDEPEEAGEARNEHRHLEGEVACGAVDADDLVSDLVGLVGQQLLVRDRQDRRRVIVTPDEDVIRQRVMPHYAGQAEHLDRVLERRTREEMQTIAAFFEDLVGGGADDA